MKQYNQTKKARTADSVYISCGFQRNLRIQRSLEKTVTEDNEVAANFRMLHALNTSWHNEFFD